MEEDRTSWRDVELHDNCWMNKGVYLGKCISKGKSGPERDPDPWFKFEKGGVYEGIDLKFTKVNCRDSDKVHRRDEEPSINSDKLTIRKDEVPKKKSFSDRFIGFFSRKPTSDISGGRKYKKKTIKKRHSKKNKHTKSKKRFKK